MHASGACGRVCVCALQAAAKCVVVTACMRLCDSGVAATGCVYVWGCIVAVPVAATGCVYVCLRGCYVCVCDFALSGSVAVCVRQ